MLKILIKMTENKKKTQPSIYSRLVTTKPNLNGTGAGQN
jgi:hypothetical protein